MRNDVVLIIESYFRDDPSWKHRAENRSLNYEPLSNLVRPNLMWSRGKNRANRQTLVTQLPMVRLRVERERARERG